MGNAGLGAALSSLGGSVTKGTNDFMQFQKDKEEAAIRAQEFAFRQQQAADANARFDKNLKFRGNQNALRRDATFAQNEAINKRGDRSLAIQEGTAKRAETTAGRKQQKEMAASFQSSYNELNSSINALKKETGLSEKALLKLKPDELDLTAKSAQGVRDAFRNLKLFTAQKGNPTDPSDLTVASAIGALSSMSSDGTIVGYDYKGNAKKQEKADLAFAVDVASKRASTKASLALAKERRNNGGKFTAQQKADAKVITTGASNVAKLEEKVRQSVAGFGKKAGESEKAGRQIAHLALVKKLDAAILKQEKAKLAYSKKFGTPLNVKAAQAAVDELTFVAPRATAKKANDKAAQAEAKAEDDASGHETLNPTIAAKLGQSAKGKLSSLNKRKSTRAGREATTYVEKKIPTLKNNTAWVADGKEVRMGFLYTAVNATPGPDRIASYRAIGSRYGLNLFEHKALLNLLEKGLPAYLEAKNAKTTN